MAATDSGGPGEVTEHLTVGAVAARLGVAASTLRTWDRRYGLGPTDRSAGRHRRYSPDDLARLETMRALTERGVALADAARIAARPAPRDDVEEDLDPLSLAAAAVDVRTERLVSSLHLAASRLGLAEVLARRVHPAREILADATRAETPGRDPEAVLTAALLTVVRERAQQAPVPHLGPVLVVGARSQLLDAHVLAGMLHESGVRSRVSPFHPAELDAAGVPRSRRCAGMSLVIEIHPDRPSRGTRSRRQSGDADDDAAVCAAGTAGAAGAACAAAEPSESVPPCGTHDVLLVGRGAPRVEGAFRVRTLAAAAPRALELIHRD